MSRSPSAFNSGIGWILRAGVIISLVLESAGLVLEYLSTGDSSPPNWPTPGSNFFGFLASTFSALRAGAGPETIAGLGIAVLVLTPYARVVAAVAYYSFEGDWKYVGITLSVFLIITTGLVAL